jgi:uncharacterized Zn finger protein (UPF0148 family)
VEGFRRRAEAVEFMPRIRCPSCKDVFVVDAPGGAVVECPNCEARVRVPKAAGAEASPTSKTSQLNAVALVRCPKCRKVLTSPSRTAVVTCPTCNIRIKPKLSDSDTDSRRSSAVADSGVKMDCPKCGRPLSVSARDGSAGCRNCGAKLRMRLEEESSSDSDTARRTSGGSRSGRIRITSVTTPSGKTKTVQTRVSASRAALNPMTESFLEKMDDLARPSSPDDSLLIAATAARQPSGRYQPVVTGVQAPVAATAGSSAGKWLLALFILALLIGLPIAGLMLKIIDWPEWLPRPDWLPL